MHNRKRAPRQVVEMWAENRVRFDFPSIWNNLSQCCRSDHASRSICEQFMKRTQSTPKASRPRMPKNYGVPRTKTGLLEWSDVGRRLAMAKHYWIATVTPDGRPHSTPV